MGMGTPRRRQRQEQMDRASGSLEGASSSTDSPCRLLRLSGISFDFQNRVGCRISYIVWVVQSCPRGALLAAKLAGRRIRP